MCYYYYTGCMAERLKAKLLETEKAIDLVAGPGIHICMYNYMPTCVPVVQSVSVATLPISVGLCMYKVV